MPERSNGLISAVLLAVLTLIWGSSFILIKLGLNTLPVLQVGSLRIVTAFIILFPIFLTRLKHVKRRHLPYLASSGILGSFAPSLLFSLAGTNLSSSVSGSINAVTPLFTLLIGVIFFQKSISRIAAIGLFLGFAGTLVLASNGKNLSLADYNWYSLFAVIATVCYGINVNFISSKLQDLHPLTLTSGAFSFAGPLALIILFFNGKFVEAISLCNQADFNGDFIFRLSGSNPGNAAVISISAIVFLGLFGSAMATVMFNRLIQISSTEYATSVTYLMPIVAIGWGMVFGEHFTIVHFLGALVVLLGVYLVNKNFKASAD